MKWNFINESIYQHSNDSHHVGVAGPGLKADGHVAAAGVDDALSEDRTKLGHYVLVLVGDHLDAKVEEIVKISRTILILRNS